MASVLYDLKQGEARTISNPMYVAAIGGDNPTPFYLNITPMPPGMQWVFPFTYGFMYPIDPPQQVRVDASKTPNGYPVAPASTSQALLTAWDSPQLYAPGTRSDIASGQAAISGTSPQWSASYTLNNPSVGLVAPTITQLYAIPPGTRSISVRAVLSGTGGTVTVVGNISGFTYMTLGPPAGSPTTGYAILQYGDTGLLITTSLALGGSSMSWNLLYSRELFPQTTYNVRGSAISTGALGAGGSKVIASFQHGGGASKYARLRRLKLYPDAITAATTVQIELLYFSNTTLASGGAPLTATPFAQGGNAAELGVQTLPTTPGATETAVPLAFARLGYGIIAGSTSDLYRDGIPLYDHRLSDMQPPTLRNGNQEGWNLKLSTSTAATLTFSFDAEFTEFDI